MIPDRIRACFPGTRRVAYFNAAAASLLPQPVRAKMDEVAARWVERGILAWKSDLAVVDGARAAVAELIGAQPRDIALVANTAEGLSRVAEGLAWEPGDEVVLGDLEYPANFYPWVAQRHRGVRVRLIPSAHGRLPAERLIDAIGPRTRVVAVSWVQFTSGFRVDLAKLGEACRRRGVLLAVDAIQGLGVFPLNVQAAGIGALAADGRKWLMGPAGAGLLYVDPAWVPRIRPHAVGALSVRDSDDYLQYLRHVDEDGQVDLDRLFREGAGRYEAGYPNVVGAAGLGAAIELGNRIGRGHVRETVERLVARLCDGVLGRGWEIHGPHRPEERSGIVSFTVPGDPSSVARELHEVGFSVAVRSGRLRAAPHVYNTPDEVDGLLDALDRITSAAR